MSEDWIKPVCSLGVAVGAALLGGVGWAAGATALELLGKGGELGLDIAASQRDAVTELEKRIRNAVEKNYRTWLASSGSAARRPEEIEAALEQLGEALIRTRPTFLEIESVQRIGLDGKPIPNALSDALLVKLKSLDATSIFITSIPAAGVYRAMVEGVASLARTDAELAPTFNAVRFDLLIAETLRIKEQFEEMRRADERRHAEILAAIARDKGVDPGHLVPLFEAVAMDVPSGDFERAVREAVEILLARAKERPAILQDGAAIRDAIQAARDKLARLDTEGALAILRAARAEEAANREARAHGEARLAVEEADILRATYQWDAAIEVLHAAAALEPEEAWYWGEIGDIHRSRGRLSLARRAYEAALELSVRLGTERNLSVSHNRIGDVLVSEGRLPDARAAFEASLAVRQKLAASDPKNVGWQRDLFVSHHKVGDVLVKEGRLPKARAAYEAGLAISQKLAASDPGNAGWQRDLSVSHNAIGNVLGNAEWQRDLSISHNKIGDVLVKEGRMPEARAAYEAGLVIAQKLVVSDPGHVDWQRDLSISHNKIGDVLVSEGRLHEARTAYETSLGIRLKLSASDPGNAEWQRDLIISHLKLNDPASALPIARDLAASGRLAPADAWMIADLERRFAEAD